jgi:hypothetical protein
MKFTELNEQERIQYIKDGFILILEQLAKDPSKLKNYIKVPEKPKQVQAVVERIIESMTDEQKSEILDRNKIAQAKAAAENEKIDAGYSTIVEHYKKVEAIITKLEKKEGCLCGSCVNLGITNSVIPNELEVLIDAARKEAEERNY